MLTIGLAPPNIFDAALVAALATATRTARSSGVSSALRGAAAGVDDAAFAMRGVELAALFRVATRGEGAAPAGAAPAASLAISRTVSCRLCTVTFHANLAHSLTRSP